MPRRERDFIVSAPQNYGRILEQVLRQRPPNMIRGVRAELGEDSSGDPALFVYLIVDDEDLSDAQIAELSAYASKVRDSVLEMDASRFPYVQLKTAA